MKEANEGIPVAVTEPGKRPGGRSRRVALTVVAMALPMAMSGLAATSASAATGSSVATHQFIIGESPLSQFRLGQQYPGQSGNGGFRHDPAGGWWHHHRHHHHHWWW